jgi:hypothetical protein
MLGLGTLFMTRPQVNQQKLLCKIPCGYDDVGEQMKQGGLPGMSFRYEWIIDTLDVERYTFVRNSYERKPRD